MRCRASQRRFRNTLLFVAADEAQLGDGARGDAQGAGLGLDRRGRPRFRTSYPGAGRPTQARRPRPAATAPPRRCGSPGATSSSRSRPRHRGGKAFDLEHLRSRRKDRAAIPAAVYEKAQGRRHRQGEARRRRALAARSSRSGPRTGRISAIAEVADWFAVLRLSAEAARPRGAGGRDPRRGRQARSRIRLRRRLRRGDRAIRRPALGRRRRATLPPPRCSSAPAVAVAQLRPRPRQATASAAGTARTPPRGRGLANRLGLRTERKPARASRAASTARSKSTWSGR